MGLRPIETDSVHNSGLFVFLYCTSLEEEAVGNSQIQTKNLNDSQNKGLTTTQPKDNLA